MPQIPPTDQRIRVIIDTDAGNEINDIWAISLALLAPERLQIMGFVAANYDNERPDAGPDRLPTLRIGFMHNPG